MKLIYTGSVKNIYQTQEPTELFFEYTDDYSVFDWGKMPDPIPGKGEILSRLGEFFFRALEDPGQWKALEQDESGDIAANIPIVHHFIRRESNRLLVTKVDVPHLKAESIGGSLVYDYGFQLQPRQLIPLEVLFRFGVPAGSSLLKRKHWYNFDIREGAEFKEPLIEFSTKLENKDRVISYQEAALILKGDTKKLRELYAKTCAVALFLRKLLAERGLKLWDGKLEWAFIDGQVSLVDSIGPDELRVSQGDAVFSKQFLRNYYLDSPWLKAVEEGGRIAQERGTENWKDIVVNELKSKPDNLSAPYLEAAKALYQDFHDIVVEGRQSTRFTDALAAL
ncbi:MAG: hypothetical protein OEZ59_01540 [Deltaproteobacteria bacterium]|nr:hypothetical protein [Deltaproteobacteria bacterium]